MRQKYLDFIYFGQNMTYVKNTNVKTFRWKYNIVWIMLQGAFVSARHIMFQ